MKPRSNTELKAELARLKADAKAFLARIDREYAERTAVGSEYTMIRVVYDISTDQLLPLPAAGLVLSHEGISALRTKVTGATSRALQTLIDAGLAEMVCPQSSAES